MAAASRQGKIKREREIMRVKRKVLTVLAALALLFSGGR
jgi:hypothetical protein